MAIVSIDSGSTLLKWLTGAKRGLFPSQAVQVPPELRGRSRSELKCGGEVYLVGEAARSASLTATLEADRGEDFHGSERQKAQYCWAFEQMHLESGTHRALLTTLPLTLAYDKERVATIKNAFKRFAWDYAGKKREVDFQEVIITPQGAGAWLRYRAANPKKAVKRTLVCDVGGATVDLCLIQWRSDLKDYDYHIRSHSEGGWNLSVWARTLMDALRHEFPGRQFDFQELMDALLDATQNGRPCSINHLGQAMDISKFVATARESFTQALYAICEKSCGDFWASLDDVIVTGGGAVFLEESAWPDGRKPVILDIYANVDGQHHELEAEIAAA